MIQHLSFSLIDRVSQLSDAALFGGGKTNRVLRLAFLALASVFFALPAPCYSCSSKSAERAENYKSCVEAARKGDVRATWNVAIYYLHGAGVAKDVKKAVATFQKISESDNKKLSYMARTTLGNIYYKGEHTKKDLVNAERWYTKAYEVAPSADQAKLLKIMRIIEQEKMDKNSIKAASENNSMGFDFNSDFFEDCGKKTSKDKIFCQFHMNDANSGSEALQLKVGEWYYFGNYLVNKDHKKSAYWFSRAAEQGSAKARFYLGKQYQNGQGVAKDIQIANQLLATASSQGVTGKVECPKVMMVGDINVPTECRNKAAGYLVPSN